MFVCPGVLSMAVGKLIGEPNVRLIHLTSDKVERFLAFRRQGLNGDPDGFRYAVADDDATGELGWRERLQRDFVVAAERDDDLLGIGGFSRLVGARLDHKGLIWGMYVAPAARGSGVADRVMAALMERARPRASAPAHGDGRQRPSSRFLRAARLQTVWSRTGRGTSRGRLRGRGADVAATMKSRTAGP